MSTPRRGQAGAREGEQSQHQTPGAQITSTHASPDQQGTPYVTPLAVIPSVTPVYNNHAAPGFSPGPLPSPYQASYQPGQPVFFYDTLLE
jgi:hypothetical protein